MEKARKKDTLVQVEVEVVGRGRGKEVEIWW